MTSSVASSLAQDDRSSEMTSGTVGDAPFYLLAVVCGVGTGWADVVVDDLLFTALLVLASCMLLGIVRRRWPWRWVLVVGGCIPLTEFAAYKIQSVKPTHAQVYGSFLAFLPGIAGAYGGSIVRTVYDNLREGK
jgi:hypothetical protein